MKHIFSALVISSFILFAASCGKKAETVETDSKELAEDQNEEKFDSNNIEKDTEFVVAAADAGMLEVQLGQLAVANGSTAEVKQLGQAMIDEHGKANEELKTVAQQKNISVPAVLSEKCQKKYEELSKKTGLDFDKEYTTAMVKDHKDAIDLFKKEGDKGNDPELKTWAAGKVPTLEHHLAMSESAEKIVKDKKK